MLIDQIAEVSKPILILSGGEPLLRKGSHGTQQNYGEIGSIMTLAEKHGASSFHLFFLVPTGRGVDVEDISADMY